jgi:hypothetical protein
MGDILTRMRKSIFLACDDFSLNSRFSMVDFGSCIFKLNALSDAACIHEALSAR